MKYLLYRTMACCLLTASCVTPTQDAAIQIDAAYGYRDFSESDEWEQTDRQSGAFGLQGFVGPTQGGGLEFGFICSEDDSSDEMYANRTVDETDTQVREMYAGGRHNWMLTDEVQIYLGGGITSVTVETTVDLDYSDDSPSTRDTAFAPYVQVGTNLFLIDNLAVGAFYRRNFLDSEADIFIHNANVDGDLWMLTLGWRF